MTRFSLVAFAVTAFVPAFALADTAAASPEARAEALGASVESSNEKHPSGTDWGRASGVIDAPTATVLKTVTDYEHYDEFMPHFKQAKVLSHRGNDALVYMEADIIKKTTKLWAQLKIRQLPSQGTTQIVEAKMLKGNMDQFVARWELTPVAGGKRTLVDFRILVEPDLPLPSVLFSAENKKAAGRSVKALRKRVVPPVPTKG
jgi:ribosome-associated toxin RatA of RatAB toxin-antitoxin module